jgi:hypothetical protein
MRHRIIETKTARLPQFRGKSAPAYLRKYLRFGGVGRELFERSPISVSSLTLPRRLLSHRETSREYVGEIAAGFVPKGKCQKQLLVEECDGRKIVDTRVDAPQQTLAAKFSVSNPKVARGRSCNLAANACRMK